MAEKEPEKINEPIGKNPAGEPGAALAPLKRRSSLLRDPVRLTTPWPDMDPVFYPISSEKSAAMEDMRGFFDMMMSILAVSEARLNAGPVAMDMETLKSWGFQVEDEQQRTRRLEAEFDALMVNHHRLMGHFK